MIVNYEQVLKQDISYFVNELGIDWPERDGEHYRLLTYLANQFNGITFIDAGTYQGLSCLALAQNPKNKVVSYDIEKKNIPFLNSYKNVTLKTLDINKESVEEIKSAHIILLDIDPHDGIQEQAFSDFMETIDYTGYVICDDIYLNSNMAFWWRSIDRLKYEVTEVGHSHGTGIICYNTDVTIEK